MIELVFNRRRWARNANGSPGSFPGWTFVTTSPSDIRCSDAAPNGPLRVFELPHGAKPVLLKVLQEAAPAAMTPPRICRCKTVTSNDPLRQHSRPTVPWILVNCVNVHADEWEPAFSGRVTGFRCLESR
jgi:hypothetical protein